MKSVRGMLLSVAIFQIVSTLVGGVELALLPQWFTPLLAGTAFEHLTLVAAFLLGVVVGGFQWLALGVQLRRPRWLALAHALAGTVMVGWIAGECLVMNQFNFAHAIWGGAGVLQLLLVLVLLGVLAPLTTSPEPAICVTRGRSTRGAWLGPEPDA